MAHSSSRAEATRIDRASVYMGRIIEQLGAPWFVWFMTAVSAAMLNLYVEVHDSNVLESWAWVAMFSAWSCSAAYRTWYRQT